MKGMHKFAVSQSGSVEFFVCCGICNFLEYIYISRCAANVLFANLH